MEKLKINTHYLAFLICVGILVVVGSYIVYTSDFPSDDFHQNPQQTLPQTSILLTPVQPVSLAVPVSSTQDPGSICNLSAAGPRIPVPVDTSVPIQDPMPGIRYSLGENDSGKTIILGAGDVFEINLGWAAGLPFRWIVAISGCGLELVNDGNFVEGVGFWNTTGNYRARYRAVNPGTSVIDGKLVLKPDEPGDLRFNLTVIVK